MIELNKNEKDIKEFILGQYREKFEKGEITARDLQEKIKAVASTSADTENVNHANIYKSINTDVNIKYDGNIVTIENVQKDHEDWFKPELKTNWKRWSRYKKYISKEIGHTSALKLDEWTDLIIKKLEDPKKKKPFNRKGLVIGYIQSGKTANYIGLVNKALDAGYKIIIVLAARYNDLRVQTNLRFDEGCFGWATTQDDLLKKKKVGVGLIDGNFFVNSCTSSEAKGDFNKEVKKGLNLRPDQDPLVMVVKKNVSILKNINEWIEERLEDDGVVREIPMLVIDDECDDASIDTKAKYIDESNKPDPEINPTKTNEQIRAILKNFKKSAYVAYSATPFANVLIHHNTAGNVYGEDLFPRDFIVSLPKNDLYIGFEDVFYEEGKQISDKTIINDFVDDPKDLKNDKATIGWMPQKHTKGHIPMYKNEKIMPPSLKRAVYCFMNACCIASLRNQNKANTMLVHVSKNTNVHQEVQEQIQKFISEIEAEITINSAETGNHLQSLKDNWNEEFLNNLDKNKNPNNKNIDWEDVKNKLPEIIQKTKTIILNGESEDILNYEEDNKKRKCIIVIGGDKLSRGITLEGLKTSYFLRHSKIKIADTLIQMSRWFGYHKDYFDTCRIFSTDAIIERFRDISEADENFRNKIEYMMKQNQRPDQFGLQLQQNNYFKITAPNKQKFAKKQRVDFNNYQGGTLTFYKDKYISENIQITENFLNQLGSTTEEQNSYYMWIHKNCADIAAFIKNLKIHHQSRNFSPHYISDYLNKQSSEKLRNWTVVLKKSGKGKQYKLGKYDLRLTIRSDITPHDNTRYSFKTILDPLDTYINLDKKRIHEEEKIYSASKQKISQKIRSEIGQSFLIIYPFSSPEANEGQEPYIGCYLQIPWLQNSKPVNYLFNAVAIDELKREEKEYFYEDDV